MEGFRNNIDSLADTSTLENILIAIIYWMAILVVILLIFYIAVKIHNVVLKKNHRKMRELAARAKELEKRKGNIREENRRP